MFHAIGDRLLPILLACLMLSRIAAADDAVPVLPGSWTWPDQGLSLDPKGDNGEGGAVYDMVVHDDTLIVVGGFQYADGLTAQNIAGWRGDPNGELGGWFTLGSSFPNGTVITAISADGSLYIGGGFGAVGSTSAVGVAKWDGVAWSSLGNGPGGITRALAWWNDGTGATLYAGGSFPQRLKKWNGLAWVAVGGGCTQAVHDLAVYDIGDGYGPALYAGGDFGSCGGTGAKVARWDGQSWTALGAGITSGASYVTSVIGFDDGSGPAIYAAGSFTEVDGQPLINIARWNGKVWSPVGDPKLQYFETIEALRVLDEDGDGPIPPALFALGGSILQKWNGQSWIAYPQPGGLLAATVFPDAHGALTLHAGGTIAFLQGEPPELLYTKIARWDGPTGFGCKSADFDGDGVIDQADLGILLAAFNCPGPGCKGDADGDGDVDQADLGILLANFGQKCG